MRTSTQCLLVLGLCAWLFSTPSCARADSADDLQAQYDAVQREMNANAGQITSLQNKLDTMPNKGAGPDSHGGHSDFQSIKNTILDLKQKNNDLFAKGDEAATQLRKMGRDPDRPQPSHGSAGTDSKPTDLPVDASSSAASKPLQKQDIGEVATADVNSVPPEIIPLKLVLPVNTQNVPPVPIASNSKTISPPIPPVQIDPAFEQAIDEKVRKQKPEVDALFAPPPAEPESSVDLVAAPPVAPAEPPQVEPPTTDWGSIVLGTILVGGAIAGGVAASSGGGGGYSSGGTGYSTGAGTRHPSGGGGYGGGICH